MLDVSLLERVDELAARLSIAPERAAVVALARARVDKARRARGRGEATEECVGACTPPARPLDISTIDVIVRR
jgi:hypothetical protein